MIVLVWICLMLLPLCTGMGAIMLLEKRFSFGDSWLLGGQISVLLAEICHLAGVYGNASLSGLQGPYQAGLFGMAGVSLAVTVFFRFGKKIRMKPFSGEKSVYPFLFLGLLLFLLLLVFCKKPIVVPGDWMEETVRSFLKEDGVFRVNPFNGRPYEEGLSGRIKILGLPTWYALLAGGFRVEVRFLLYQMIPPVVLMASMLAYYRLSRILFGDEKKWKYLFLFFVLLVFWCSDGAEYLDGYAVLHSAYLGSSIRNLVLYPLCFSCVLQIFSKRGNDKKGSSILLLVTGILTEACISPTFFGIGMCLILCVAAAGYMTVRRALMGRMIGRLLQKHRQAKEAEQ